MKRLPVTVALLLLVAGVWNGLDRPVTKPEIGRDPVKRQQSLTTDRESPDRISPPPPRNPRQPLSHATPARGVPITPELIRTFATGPEKISFQLPDGRAAEGVIEQRHTTADGSPTGVTGRLVAPGSGSFHFRIQPDGAPTGPVVGAVVIDGAEIAFQVRPGAGNTSVLSAAPVDQVICRRLAPPPEIAAQPQEIPADHPTDIPYPPYQNGVIPLQSRPDAVGVIYLDFDGEPGPHEGWQDSSGNDFDALPPQGMTPALIKNIWAGVAEDFAPFNLNVTTDLQVYLDAPETSRQRCIITPTNTARPGAGGVAWVGSFGWSGDTPCWCFFYSNAKNANEIISHEIGHTLGLSHDGQAFPNSDIAEYYWGHGSYSNGWAPIMGVGYNKSLTQWSKGEYLYANRTEDDIAIIAGNGNVGLIADDAGDNHSTAAILEVFSSGAVESQGCIGTQTDVDAFRFTTTGGNVSLAVTPSASGGNLDILASLHEADGDLVAQANPNLDFDATLSANLAAGEYTIRVDGTGKDNPLVLGYTDYGSLGTYKINGTIIGAVGPDRFNLAENPQVGTSIGTPLPRLNHGGSPLTYSISSGNTNSTFAIDPVSGEITVADPASIDFEALSAGWDHPSAFELTVTISDPVTPALNESLRVVIGITNVNEPPALSGSTSIIAVSNTVSGVNLGNLTVTDPDRFDYATAQIIAGDPAGKFSLSPSGALTLTGSLDATAQATYQLTVRTTDQGTPALSTDQTVTVSVLPSPPGLAPGLIYQTVYDNIPGDTVMDLANDADFPTRPATEVELADFSTITRDDTYGSTVRTLLIAPVTGNYQFWISGDDSAELFLSPDGIPANMASVCSLAAPTKRYEWTKFPSQQSAVFALTAGQVCYVEARHKEQFQEDHLSVAWEIRNPADTIVLLPRQVIPGRYLSPSYLNYSPTFFPENTRLYRNSYAGYQVASSFATDPNASDTLTWAITAGNGSGAFAIDSTTGEVTVANSGILAGIGDNPVVLTLTVTDNGVTPLTDSGPLTIHLLDPLTPPTSGLVQEFWDGIPGTALADLYASARYPERPDRVANLVSFEAETTMESDFGARIRAYFIPPVGGSYTFSIFCADDGSLFLSSDTNPANAFEIASSGGSQASLPVPLNAGQRYYIEARVKHATGNSQLKATWAHSSFPSAQVIGDDVTEPYDSNVAPVFSAPSYSFDLPENFTTGTLAGAVTATDSTFESIRYAIISGDPLQAFAIHPKTGAISVANPSNLVIGSVYQIQVGAQDSGHGRNFAPRVTLVPVTVSLPNDPPQFTSNPVDLGQFPATQPISQSLAAYVTDAEDPVLLAMVSGPSWLSLSPAGILSGTPSFADFGPHLLVVSADDGRGNIVQGSVSFVVSVPANIPEQVLTTSNANGMAIMGTHDPETTSASAASDNLHETLHEALFSDTSALEYTWTFATTPNRPALLEIEAYHPANTDDDDFQFSISTDGGETFTDAILISNNSDDDILRQFPFTAGSGSSTIVRVVDTNRNLGNSNLDTLFIDLLTVTLAANTAPSTSNATYQVADHAPLGVAVGSAAATDADPGQSITYSILHGNSAGLFSITPTGMLEVAGVIPTESGPYSLIVVATDNGIPALANYSTITINVVHPVAASVLIGELSPTYNGLPRHVTVTTDPPNLPTTILYNVSPPINAGTYTVTATIDHPYYVGSASETLTVEKSPASIMITGLSQPYDGFEKSVTVTTSPPDLDHSLTYNGSTSAPSSVGDYTVTATITDPNHSGVSVETFSITNHLNIATGQTFTVPATVSPYQSLLNDGILVVSAHPLQITGNAVNNSVLRLFGDAVLTVSGTFTNTGVIDTINWNGTLPPGLVNTGTILDRPSLRILSTATIASQFTLSVPDISGHLYQLETSNLTDPWTPLGPPVSGSGDPMNPPPLQFTPSLSGPARFYRVVVTPAP